MLDADYVAVTGGRGKGGESALALPLQTSEEAREWYVYSSGCRQWAQKHIYMSDGDLDLAVTYI